MSVTLKGARVSKGYTQVQAAKILGTSVDTISNYERGISFPDVPMIIKIEKAYDVKYSDIIFLPHDYDKTVNEQ